MVVVAMAENDKIESLQIDAKGVRIGCKVWTFRSGIEENAPAGILDESGIAPPSLEVRRFPECVEEDGHPRCGFCAVTFPGTNGASMLAATPEGAWRRVIIGTSRSDRGLDNCQS